MKKKRAPQTAKPRLQIHGYAQTWFPAIALFLTAFLLLALGYSDYMRKVESLSLFLPTGMFFDQCMSAPAGFLQWVSLWLTQAFYSPWLGALVFAALLTTLAFTIKGAFGLSRGAFGLAIVPPAMALLGLLNLGYVIFSLKTPGYAFLFPLGLLAATLLYWGVRAVKIWWVRLLAVLVAIVAGYWLTGFYGLLAGGLCMLSEIKLNRKELVGHIAIIVVGIAAIIIVPKAWFSLVGGDLMIERTYLYGLPRFSAEEGALKAPYWIAFACLVLFALCGKSKWLGSKPLASLIVCVLALGSVFVFRNTDPNFRLTLSLDRALQEGDWQGALDRAKAFKGEPTRLNTALADVAAIRLGVAGDELFALPYGSADYKTARALRVMHEAGALPISYHLGFTNYAYRWAMESKVEYGANVEQLKYFAKCALLNGEYPLARKYLRILAMTANHKAWAEKYMAYADNPALIDADPELGSIKRLMRADDQFIQDNHTFESYVWRHLAGLQGGSPEQQELSIIAALISNDIDLAVSKMEEYNSLAGRLPKHMQEAAVMYAYGNDLAIPASFAIDPAVTQRFAQFLQAYNTYGETPPEQQLQIIKDSFGDTYWFYFFYAPNMKII
ncbi:MAG: hypothetical protein K2N16_00345 [Muribaculaceae bacterium]|nr:hypothetical protein [Muribaculaceae bacterium]